ncbi:MAG TPA: tetratricopeptide repeat protein [Methanospirillum sp.]|uniref:tetratricopeptide repeat protein n=1 Tax=Methanospirillum sp. TaxID=45200 RepID=UPI002B63EF3E|nr:tetratricopeptide repeat protein [Methanospirillum sp.]HPY59493.1 tetratricopeptide repeat protein [Methanospirillum sp.]
MQQDLHNLFFFSLEKEKNLNNGRIQIIKSNRMLKKIPIIFLIPMLVLATSAAPVYTGEDLFEIGNGHYSQGSLDKAIEFWMQAKLADPSLSANAWYNIGLAYAGLKEYEKAVMAWNETVKLVPNSSMAYDNMGTAYGLLGMYEEAGMAYDMAIAIDPDVVKYRIDKELLLKSAPKEETPLSPLSAFLALITVLGILVRHAG